ncbi:MAG: 1-deoxy-D-xylulose 5-phosphate reductoisomerase [Planctomycetota bacterium]
MTSRQNVAILGATGSIGRATCEVLRHLGMPYRAWGLSAHRDWKTLLQLARDLGPEEIVLADSQVGIGALSDIPVGCRLKVGAEGLEALAASAEIDTVVAAIVGSAGLASTLAAVRGGKRVALANKEAMVVAGPIMIAAAAESGAEILPVDSEHSAIFQAMQAGGREEVQRVILTASGGPFLRSSKAKLAEVTVEEACRHPTWNMGRKITIDSATMMNKALEVIEARWLFQIPAEKIHVMVHPQSVIHSMVEFRDGSVLAQMSPPDMKLPIQYALTFPKRLDSPTLRMDWSESMKLEMEPVDFERFPALLLGFEVARVGGTAGAVLNAANEAAVEQFLAGRIRFVDIASVCRDILNHHTFEATPSIQRLAELDRWARQEVLKWNSF